MSAEQYGARLLEEVQEESLEKVSFWRDNLRTEFVRSAPLSSTHPPVPSIKLFLSIGILFQTVSSGAQTYDMSSTATGIWAPSAGCPAGGYPVPIQRSDTSATAMAITDGDIVRRAWRAKRRTR